MVGALCRIYLQYAYGVREQLTIEKERGRDGELGKQREHKEREGEGMGEIEEGER